MDPAPGGGAPGDRHRTDDPDGARPRGDPRPRLSRPDDRRTRLRRGGGRAPQDAIYRLIRWLGGHVHSLWVALGVFLMVGLGLAALTLGLFGWLAEAVAVGLTRRFDEAAVAGVRSVSGPVLDWLAIAGAGLGSGVAMWIVLVIGTVLLWRARNHFSVLLLWVALLGGRILNHELKALFARPRPTPDTWGMTVLGRTIDFPTSFSFPSGHATTAVVMFGTLAYLVARLESTPRQRRWTFGAAAVLILLIGWSRIYLGVHYPSDVLAGYLSGLLWSTMVVVAIEVVRHYAVRDPRMAEEERGLERGLDPLREVTSEGPT